MPLYGPLRTGKDKTRNKVIASRLLELRSALRSHIYGLKEGEIRQHERNDKQWLRIATWNIREFDTKKYGGRCRDAYYYIAEIISHFDLVAIQEVREDLTALRKVMDILGSRDWDYIATDVTEGKRGNRERMVFVYNVKKVRFTNVAGEITLEEGRKVSRPGANLLRNPDGLAFRLPDGGDVQQPDEIPVRRSRGKTRLDRDIVLGIPGGTGLTLPEGSAVVLKKGTEVECGPDGKPVLPFEGEAPVFPGNAALLLPDKVETEEKLQFARTPFVVTFQAGWLKFMLCTVHIYYGSGKSGLAMRNQEIRKITGFLAKRAERENDSDADNFFFVLGDFNIIGKDHATWESLHTNNFMVPEELKEIPEGSNVRRDKAYDQIAYWNKKRRRRRGATSVDIGKAGVFDFFKHVFREGDDDPGGEDEAFFADLVGKTRLGYRKWRTYQMSDHLPMWLELRIDFCEDYLERIVEDA